MSEEVPADSSKRIMSFNTSAELKEFLNSSQNERRMKFAVRVFYVLQWTTSHPEAVQDTGAIWCKNGYYFICNSTLIGEFLNIRPNTINTNFRSHLFTIELSQPQLLLAEFPMIKDTRNWRKRVNHSFPFHSGCTELDIIRIPCRPLNEQPKNTQLVQYPVRAPKLPPRRIIKQVQTFEMPMTPTMKYKYEFKNSQETKEYEKDIEIIFNNMKGTKEQKDEIINKAQSLWKEFGDVPKCQSNIIVSYILKNIDLDVGEKLAPHLTKMLSSDGGSGNTDISFAQYLKFYAQYGDPATIIETLTDFIDYSSKNYVFYPWFQPDLGKINTKIRLLDEDGPDFIVRCSASKIGIFVLEVVENKSSGEISSSNIDFDPIKPSFSIISESHGLVQDKSLKSLLFDRLGLKLKQNVNFEPIIISSYSQQTYSSQQVPSQLSSQSTN
ncbi:hypothetical protein TVAG_110850 [Trichomonas vaginalis G3]|uniref:Initiator binding domain-containing protein n=1 Tax=Trichomonas vaginalis (strain ATCC PRA-98 / G3) TaxID=412133 RepID=A2DGT5_TRIV3|nr:hypothetical protein TVAGG3_0997010 [Trichomonas vaginalis G3]EAY20472.1 hypothetical protein TVAG_110850 [Trichomonas vaginalis G3]KAI5490474.1 hypothetical protein TVAGG3_0997010 [Trichomonas vaginalis G3]|eukprot:XP_001581458.1 hypothetical protein [Trichomonas vaginalis G3]